MKACAMLSVYIILSMALQVCTLAGCFCVHRSLWIGIKIEFSHISIGIIVSANFSWTFTQCRWLIQKFFDQIFHSLWPILGSLKISFPYILLGLALGSMHNTVTAKCPPAPSKSRPENRQNYATAASTSF